MVGVEITGLSELSAACKELEAALIKENLYATQQALIVIKDAAVQKAPYKTGTLRRSIAQAITSKEGAVSVTGTVGSDLPYAAITELGGVIKPKGGNILAWKDPSSPYAAQAGKYQGWVFTRKPVVRVAKPYLFPSLIEKFTLILQGYQAAWDRASANIQK